MRTITEIECEQIFWNKDEKFFGQKYGNYDHYIGDLFSPWQSDQERTLFISDTGFIANHCSADQSLLKQGYFLETQKPVTFINIYKQSLFHVQSFLAKEWCST